MRSFRSRLTLALVMGVTTTSASRALAVSYASNVVKTGTTVNFTLNSPADVLSYSINGGAPITLDGTTKGAKTFNLPSANATFSIVAERTDAVGFTIGTGATIPAAGSGMSAESNEGGLNVISDATNVLGRFNSPRGVSVSNNPNAPNFGTAYIVNSASGAVTANGPLPARTLTNEGLYALRADGTDAYGFSDAAQNPMVEGFPAWVTTSANSGFRNFVADDGSVYVTDYSDANGSLIHVTPNLSTGTNVLTGFGGQGTLPAGQNHGSLTAVHVEGSIAAGNLTVYTVDEDLTTNHATGAGSTADKNSLWRYDIGSGPLSSSAIPTKLASVLLSGSTSDMERGADGKWYVSQWRNTSSGTSLYVLSEDGSTVLYDSLIESRNLTGNQALAVDIMQNYNGVTISPDQKWMAAMLWNSDVAVVPLIGGIPDLANRMVINASAGDVTAGRDIAFDAAGNIHYVSSGDGVYQVLAPGGHSIATTTWNGTEFVFGVTGGATPGLAGDFNGDDIVDGADFLVWQRGGSPNPLSQADLTEWKGNFGTTAAAPVAAAVPEPASAAMALLGVVGCLAAARRRHQ